MLEKIENNNIHGPRILIEASINSSWFKEALSDIAGTLASSLAIFALKRHTEYSLEYQKNTSTYAAISGIWFAKTLITTAFYNFGASWCNYMNSMQNDKIFGDLFDVKANIQLFSIFGSLEIADIAEINPGILNFFSKGYLKARLAVSSLKAVGIIIGDALGSLDVTKLFKLPYTIPRAVVGNFVADAIVRFSKLFGVNKELIIEPINSFSREFAQTGFDSILDSIFPKFTVVNMTNSTISAPELHNSNCSVVPFALSKFLNALDDEFNDNVELKICALQQELHELHTSQSDRDELQSGISKLKKELLFTGKTQRACEDVVNEYKKYNKIM